MQRNKQRQLPRRLLHRKRHKRDPLKIAQFLVQLIGPLHKLNIDILKSIIDSLQCLIKGSVLRLQFNPGVGWF